MSELDVIQALAADRDALADKPPNDPTLYRAGDGPAVEVAGLEAVGPEVLHAQLAAPSEEKELIAVADEAAPVDNPWNGRKHIVADEPSTEPTPSAEALAYLVFCTAARSLKDTEAAFRAAQKAYGEAVNALSEVVTKS